MIQVISGAKIILKRMAQKYLVFQSMNRYLKKISNPDHISEWKSKGFSDKVIKPPATADNNLASILNYACKKMRKKNLWKL